MKNVIMIALACALTVSCSRPEKATSTLHRAGYTDIQTTGWDPFGQAEDDVWSTGFKAKSPSGHIVEGTVSGGWFKGATIRYD